MHTPNKPPRSKEDIIEFICQEALTDAKNGIIPKRHIDEFGSPEEFVEAVRGALQKADPLELFPFFIIAHKARINRSRILAQMELEKAVKKDKAEDRGEDNPVEVRLHITR